MNDIKVSVCMITYGHEAFIEEAINGVLMQECNFNVELIITNDCSPDATDQVVKKIIENHPNASWIRYIKHEKNMGMMPNFVYTLKEAKGKYIALCEGDDYWTDPLKLQKQVDFLDENTDCMVTGTNAIVVDENNKLISDSKLDKASQNGATRDLLKRGYLFLTLTIMFRNIDFKKHFNDETKDIYNGDLFLTCIFGHYGSYKYLDTVEKSAYRVHSGGVWSLNKKNIQIYKSICSFYQIANFYKKNKDYKYALIFSLKVFSLLLYERKNLFSLFNLEIKKAKKITTMIFFSILNIFKYFILNILSPSKIK
jgi:glycosyltransferase involved in cell wall biosynthesis